MINRFITVLIVLLVLCDNVGAQTADTLQPVELLSRKPAAIARSATGVQELNKEELRSISSVSVADAVKYFSGVLVKDYGGIGGLKTISVRSLGASHTGVMLDGMVMADARAGVIDLGRLSIENLEYVRLYQSHSNEWVLPARSYASANLLVLKNSSNVGVNEKLLRLSYTHGSFGYVSPSINFASPLSKRASFRLNGNYQKAHGRYMFDNYASPGKSERINTDVEQWKVEMDIPVLLPDSSTFNAKAYFYQSGRGLPGSVLLFNESANDRLFNLHMFGQVSWKKAIAERWMFTAGAKTLFDRQKYVDPDFLNNEGYLENDFYQKENYFTAGIGYQPGSKFRTSISTDYYVNKLQRRDPFDARFADPSRRNFLNNLSLTYSHKRYEFSTNALHTSIKQSAKIGEAAHDFQKIVPAVSFAIQPARDIPFRVRAFYKEIFRAPSLDDLYYTFVGNIGLTPESSRQYNLGLTWHSHHPNKFFRQILMTADHYFIMVKDKILALPRNNLFQWSMMNVGRAKTRSLDMTIAADFNLRESLNFHTNFSYSYQQARDVTNPGSPGFKLQLPYVPVHSGSARLRAERKNIAVSWNLLFSSERYRPGDQVAGNLLQAYMIHDLHLLFSPASSTEWNYQLSMELNNLFDKQYEVVKYFPMPAFNWRISLIVNHKKLKKR